MVNSAYNIHSYTSGDEQDSDAIGAAILRLSNKKTRPYP